MLSLFREKKSLKKSIEYEIDEKYKGTNIDLLFKRLCEVDEQIDDRKISKTEYYVGEIKDDKYDGFGHYVNDDGSGYFGYWKDGEKDGYGIEYDTKEAFDHFYHFHKMVVGLYELYEAEILLYMDYSKGVIDVKKDVRPENIANNRLQKATKALDEFYKNGCVMTDIIKKKYDLRDEIKFNGKIVPIKNKYINYMGNYIKEHKIEHLFEDYLSRTRKISIIFETLGGSDKEMETRASNPDPRVKETVTFPHLANCSYRKRMYGEDIVLFEGFGRMYNTGIHKELVEFMDKGKEILG